MQVEVNTKVIEQELKKLKAIELLNKENLKIKSVGQCAERQQELIDYYDTLYKNLNSLIENTISILESAKDGYIEVEEKMVDTTK